jgi:pheromone shutdown protein TraB
LEAEPEPGVEVAVAVGVADAVGVAEAVGVALAVGVVDAVGVALAVGRLLGVAVGPLSTEHFTSLIRQLTGSAAFVDADVTNPTFTDFPAAMSLFQLSAFTVTC